MGAMIRYLMVILLAVLFIAAVFMLSLQQHRINQQNVVSYFQENLHLHAHHFANQVRNLLGGYHRILETFPSFKSNLVEDMEGLKSDIQTYSRTMKKDYIETISLFDEKGNTIYSTDVSKARLTKVPSQFFIWAKKKENKGKTYVSTLFVPPNFFRLLISVPLYGLAPAGKTDRQDEKYIGALSFSVDLKQFLTQESKYHTSVGHHIWIIDKEGRLLFSSEHPEIVFRNVNQRDETCKRCHISFSYVDRILRENEGTIDYEVKGGPRKFAAFVPLKDGRLSWIVVVNAAYDSLSAITTTNFFRSLLLLGTVTLFFVLSSVYLIYNVRVKSRAEEESRHWQRMNLEKEKAGEARKRSEEQLRYLSSQLLTIQEKERSRISKELHDGLGGALSTVKLRENLLKMNLKEDQAELIKECEGTIRLVDQVMEDVRRLSRDLTPAMLENLGLSASIRWLTNENATGNNMTVTIDMKNVDSLFSQEAKISIYRIFQEAFTNIEKYAQAQNVSIVITEYPEEVSFSIEDDGKGFDLMRVISKDMTKRGLGLTTMEERVRMLGGHFALRSEEGKGTRINFRIPKVMENKG
ncbi:MAG: hypothetical protein A2156_16240 [Deltaproteobacteria bacterium RBG_16_48_10]|nr:MAG: hypothetical protein A2156_16240 [Deltaproteobacteria bacterium RBG_16_48_10]